MREEFQFFLLIIVKRGKNTEYMREKFIKNEANKHTKHKKKENPGEGKESLW
jgi:hypothetical protein